MGDPAARSRCARPTSDHASLRIERATTSELLAVARRYREIGGSSRDAFLTPEVDAYLAFVGNLSRWHESTSDVLAAAPDRLPGLPHAEDVALAGYGGARVPLPYPSPRTRSA